MRHALASALHSAFKLVPGCAGKKRSAVLPGCCCCLDQPESPRSGPHITPQPLNRVRAAERRRHRRKASPNVRASGDLSGGEAPTRGNTATASARRAPPQDLRELLTAAQRAGHAPAAAARGRGGNAARQQAQRSPSPGRGDRGAAAEPPPASPAGKSRGRGQARASVAPHAAHADHTGRPAHEMPEHAKVGSLCAGVRCTTASNQPTLASDARR